MRAMVSGIGIEWPLYEQDLGAFMEDELTIPKAKKLIEGFQGIFDVHFERSGYEDLKKQRERGAQ